mmetsp:Transcript_11956/g.18473  ORF Transcript_11956/g.18473 Transcript_11956/m.18473 type:complete len:153 (+) Transcript_11956:109-567(+)
MNTSVRGVYKTNEYFDSFEIKELLQLMIDTMLSMVPFDFKGFFLADDKFENHHFFRSIEWLGGKSLCDLEFKDPKLVLRAFESPEMQQSQHFHPLIMSLVNEGPEKEMIFQTWEETAFFEPNRVFTQDFNFVSPLERCLLQGTIKTTEILLE